MANSNSSYPRQDIPLSQKNEAWKLQHFDYGDYLLRNGNGRIEKFTRLYNEYNGRVTPGSIQYLTRNYGKQNKTKYISYRVGRPKIDLINNEFLMRPLQATVYTVNAESKSEKLEQYQTVLGAVGAKKEITKLREVGVDVLEGMPIPDEADDSIWKKMSVKDKNEVLMQTILNQQIPALGMKEKLAKNFQDIEIVAMCYGKVVTDYNGDEDYMRIDPRMAIYEEIENDTFMEKSPVMGHLEMMPVHDVLMSFKLTKEQRDEIDLIRQSPDDYIGRYGTNYKYVNGQFCVAVMFLEWKSVEEDFTKLSPKTASQMEFDPSSDHYRMDLSAKEYYDNEAKYKKEVEKGKLKIETKWKEILMSGVRIGHNILVECGEKPFTMRREDSPGNVFGFSYCGALFNTVNGERVSLQEIIENFSNAFDVTMYQILKELNKAKGKVLGYNRGVLPKGKTVKEIMYNALNDGFIDYDSTAQGNMSGRDLDITGMFKDIDLGVSSSFSALIALKGEIQQTIDRLTGINENREGQIAASSTATNAQSSIRASRTITEGMFYLMSLYTERVLVKVCETTKITWGLYKINKGRIILGDDMFRFMQLTKDIAYQDYGISLLDGGRELDLRQRFERYAESALNAKDIKLKDIVNFDMQQTLIEARDVLVKAADVQEKVRQQDLQAQMQNESGMNDANNQAMIQINKDRIEDAQLQERDMSTIDADNQIRIDNNKMGKKMLVDQNTIEQKSLFDNPQ